MSGIAGIYYLNGRPVADEQVSRMVHRMEHRGPDAQRVWTSGSVGLGHGMLHTTPESLHETLPYTSPESGCTITADARIDNRDKLFSALRIRTSSDEVIPDSRLILRAYEKWGEDCVDHLLGDFVFAIWDEREQRLFCARDHFGVRPFYYYHQSGEIFAFGSEIKALLTLEEVPRRLNEVRIADYISVMHHDTEITEYRDIYRLSSACKIKLRKSSVSKEKYWHLPQKEILKLSSDEAYAEKFRELFVEAVRCRVRSSKPVASELSGGLDSSFVTCVASQLLAKTERPPIRTVSAIFEQVAPADERYFIGKILSSEKTRPTFVVADKIAFSSIVSEISQRVDEGVYFSGEYDTIWKNYRAISKTGARVLLTGMDGDTTVGHGITFLKELAATGNWEQFAFEARLLIDRHQEIEVSQRFLEELGSPIAVMNNYARTALENLLEEREYYSFYQAIQVLSNELSLSKAEIYRNFWRKALRVLLSSKDKLEKQNRKKIWIDPFLKKGFANKINYRERLKSFRPTQSDGSLRGDQRSYLESGFMTVQLEGLNHFAASHSLQVCHPYMDKRLIEYCVRLPPDQSLGDGWTRIIMRRAMENIVPAEVQWRRGKGHMGYHVMNQLLDTDAEFAQDQIRDLGRLKEFLSLEAVSGLINNVSNLNEKGLWKLKFFTSLSYWLQQRWPCQV